MMTHAWTTETEADQDDAQTKQTEAQLNGLQEDNTCTTWINGTDDDEDDIL